MNYASILEALKVAGQPGRDESRTKTRGLMEQFSSCRMYWSLCVARVLGPAERLSKVFQSSTVGLTVSEVFAAVKTTYDLLRSDDHFEEVLQLQETL